VIADDLQSMASVEIIFLHGDACIEPVIEPVIEPITGNSCVVSRY
jgi:hypothetical protein